ncbi:transposase, YhgA-like domain protein [Leptospira sp. Fiocruz LV4135]|nr:transposase, YhgA-like domain protein [Leptospira sp. Fiocruz LV4135]
MSDVTNPHDRLIRETLQDKEDAISFFKYNLPKNVQDLLDLNGLELSQSSFISENLKEEQTDLLFQIPLNPVKKQTFIFYSNTKVIWTIPSLVNF